jgi:hypothetical protein
MFYDETMDKLQSKFTEKSLHCYNAGITLKTYNFQQRKMCV